MNYICESCGSDLKYYDKVSRMVRTKNRKASIITVKRFKCPVCNCIHRNLPNNIFPYKQYDARIITGVIEGKITTARWKVNDACNKAVREVETSLFNKISESAENAVKQAYKSMEIDAKEKIAKELRNIDVSDLKNEVKEEAAQLVKDKLSYQMDDILDTYNANLMNVQNIYSSIAKSMSARA